MLPRRRAARRRSGEPALVAARLRAAEPGIIGRQPELSRLRLLWNNATAGTPQSVLIGGEPGVGKSRLVSELAGWVEADGGWVLKGHCRQDAAVPYEPFREALDAAGVATDWTKPPERRGPRTQVLSAGVGAITALATRRPVLLVLEDLQWATHSTVLLLDHLVRRGPRSRLLVVGTYRDAAIDHSHPMAAFLDGGSDGRDVERMVLSNLPPQAVAALLVDQVAVAGRAAASLANSLWRTTEGNPLFVTEVVRYLASAGAITSGEIRPDIVERIGLPHDVAGLLTRRLGPPDDARRGVLEAASVVGEVFSTELVTEIADVKDDDLQAGLRVGLSGGVILPAVDKPGSFRFVHDVLRQSLYRALTANRRVRLHRRLAQHLAGIEDSPATVVLHHFVAATPVGRAPKAVPHAIQAGEEAMEVFAFEEAAAAYGLGLAMLGGGGSPKTRCDLVLAVAEAHHRSGEATRARQSFLQAATIARAHQDGPRLGLAVLGLGQVVGVWGADAALISLVEQATEANPDDASLRAKLLARLAQARAALDTPDQRKATSDKAWELAWDSQDPYTMGSVLRSRHHALSAPDDLEDRIEIDGELMSMATNTRDDALALEVHGWRAVDLLVQGKLTDADRDLSAHAKIARRMDDPSHLRDAAAWAAMRAMVGGRPGRARTQIDKALAFGHQARDPEADSIYWEQQHGLLLDWGHEPELDGLVEVWRNLVRRYDRAAAWRSSLALLLARTGRADEATDELDDLLSEDCSDIPLDADWLATVGAIGEATALVGFDGRATLLYRLLNPYSRRLLVVGRGWVCRGSVSRVLGMLAVSDDRWPDAERHFDNALSTDERLAAPALLARTRLDWGRALSHRRGGKRRNDQARSVLTQAAEEAARQKMPGLNADAHAALASLDAKAWKGA